MLRPTMNAAASERLDRLQEYRLAVRRARRRLQRRRAYHKLLAETQTELRYPKTNIFLGDDEC